MRFLILIVLIFSIQTLAKADDIKDFELEGMSLGDSLLDYVSEEVIKANKRLLYKSNKVATYYFPENSIGNTYQWIAINFFDNDTNFTIESIEGQIDYPNNISKCHDIKNKIYLDVKEIFSNVDLESYSGKHQSDETGKSLVEAYEFKFNDSSEIRIACTDFSKNVTYIDYLMIAINSKKFMHFLNNDAW